MKRYLLEVSVACERFKNWDEVFAMCDKIEEAVGKSTSSSGAGFGMRDLEWEFRTNKTRENAIERIQKSDTIDESTFLYNCYEDEEG